MSSQIPGLPDVPVLRHLTWREAHLFEVGLYLGFGIAVFIAGNDWGAAMALVSVGRRRMQNDDQSHRGDDRLPGYVRDAWYLGVGVIAGFLAGAIGITLLRPTALLPL